MFRLAQTVKIGLPSRPACTDAGAMNSAQITERVPYGAGKPKSRDTTISTPHPLSSCLTCSQGSTWIRSWPGFEHQIEGCLRRPAEAGEAAFQHDVTHAALAGLGAEAETNLLRQGGGGADQR